MNMIEEYAISYTNNTNIGGYNTKSILSNTSIWFVPMVNPDGVTLQQFGLNAFPSSMHSKLKNMNDGSSNFKRWKANLDGIDLNRQYNAGWATIKSNVTHPYYMNHKGMYPEQAKETKMLVNFTYQIKPEIAVSYHSAGRILYWNYKPPS
jgi:g-D-glutamyl-meso-diaminopimelate peptidase